MMTLTIRQISILAFLHLGLAMLPEVSGASITVSQSVDRSEMAFEDTVHFQISVTWDGPAHVYRFDKPFRVQAERMKVTRFSSTVRSSGSGPDEKTTKLFEYELRPHLSGMATITALNIEYITWPDSATGILVTDPVSISIDEPRPQELHTEEGLGLGWWAVILLGLAGAGAGSYVIFKRRAPKEKILTAREMFLEELEEVKREAGSNLKKFQTGLCRSLIWYIGRRYGLNTESRAAESIVTELKQVEPDQGISRTLADWLTRAEKEKYAPIAAAPGEVIRLESEIRQFFEKMK